MVENVHALTARSGTWQETTEMVQKLNRTLPGWAGAARPGGLTPGTDQLRYGNRFDTQRCQSSPYGAWILLASQAYVAAMTLSPFFDVLRSVT